MKKVLLVLLTVVMSYSVINAQDVGDTYEEVARKLRVSGIKYTESEPEYMTEKGGILKMNPIINATIVWNGESAKVSYSFKYEYRDKRWICNSKSIITPIHNYSYTVEFLNELYGDMKKCHIWNNSKIECVISFTFRKGFKPKNTEWETKDKDIQITTYLLP